MFVDEAGVLQKVSPLDIKAGIVTIPYGTKVIGAHSIANIEGVEALLIPETVTKIESHAIYGTGIVHLEIPATVTAIKPEAFANNRWLTTLVIGNENAQFDNTIVKNCRVLGAVKIGDKMQVVQCLDNGTPYHVISKKQYNVYQLFYVELFHDTIPEVRKFFFAKKQNVFGEGSNIHEAMQDCDEKYMTSEIIQKYAEITLDTLIDSHDYQTITGACDNGTADWLKEHGLKETDKKSVREIIKLLNEDSGAQLFMQFVADRYKDRANGDKHE